MFIFTPIPAGPTSLSLLLTQSTVSSDSFGMTETSRGIRPDPNPLGLTPQTPYIPQPQRSDHGQFSPQRRQAQQSLISPRHHSQTQSQSFLNMPPPQNFVPSQSPVSQAQTLYSSDNYDFPARHDRRSSPDPPSLEELHQELNPRFADTVANMFGFDGSDADLRQNLHAFLQVRSYSFAISSTYGCCGF